MLRAVFDANVFVSALIRPQGPPGQLLTRLLEDQAFELVLSSSILDELSRCLAYSRVRKHLAATDQELRIWVKALSLVADRVEPIGPIPRVPADPDDGMYLAAAIEGHADFVVSGDHHLLSLKRYLEVRILTPRAFLEILKAQHGE